MIFYPGNYVPWDNHVGTGSLKLVPIKLVPPFFVTVPVPRDSLCSGNSRKFLLSLLTENRNDFLFNNEKRSTKMMTKSRNCVWVMIRNKSGNLYNFGSNRLIPEISMGQDCPVPWNSCPGTWGIFFTKRQGLTRPAILIIRAEKRCWMK